MKTITLISLSIALSMHAFAQKTDKALARVSYNFTHIQDTTQRNLPHTEVMLLLIGKNASVFTSYDHITQRNASMKNLQEQFASQAGSTNMKLVVNKIGFKPTTKEDYFYFVTEDKFYTKENLINEYLVEETQTKINWKMSKDTASFSGIRCHKATAFIKGRNWIAWYAPELPFQSGPWKLNGLPGLIIEAYDEKKEVQFQFMGIENINNNQIVVTSQTQTKSNPYMGSEIKLPENAIKTTRKELDKLKEIRDKDPQGFMKAQFAGSTNTIQVTGVRSAPTTSSAPAKPKIVLNNPIELPERK